METGSGSTDQASKDVLILEAATEGDSPESSLLESGAPFRMGRSPDEDETPDPSGPLSIAGFTFPAWMATMWGQVVVGSAVGLLVLTALIALIGGGDTIARPFTGDSASGPSGESGFGDGDGGAGSRAGGANGSGGSDIDFAGRRPGSAAGVDAQSGNDETGDRADDEESASGDLGDVTDPAGPDLDAADNGSGRTDRDRNADSGTGSNRLGDDADPGRTSTGSGSDSDGATSGDSGPSDPINPADPIIDVPTTIRPTNPTPPTLFTTTTDDSVGDDGDDPEPVTTRPTTTTTRPTTTTTRPTTTTTRPTTTTEPDGLDPTQPLVVYPTSGSSISLIGDVGLRAPEEAGRVCWTLLQNGSTRDLGCSSSGTLNVDRDRFELGSGTLRAEGGGREEAVIVTFAPGLVLRSPTDGSTVSLEDRATVRLWEYDGADSYCIRVRQGGFDSGTICDSDNTFQVRPGDGVVAGLVDGSVQLDASITYDGQSKSQSITVTVTGLTATAESVGGDDRPGRGNSNQDRN